MSIKTNTRQFISNDQESVRMFKSNWMESLSKVHFSVPLFIFSPVIGLCLWQSEGSFWRIGGLFLVGLFVWTFVEYTLHRFIFHWIPPGKWGERLHFLWHGVHHDYPNDRLRLVLPPSVSVPLSTGFFFFYRLILGVEMVYPFFAGFILGYLCYDMMHYAMHHLQWKNSFWLKIKDHHMRHHYLEHEKGFGVSNPLWDYVFNTTFLLKKKNADINYEIVSDEKKSETPSENTRENKNLDSKFENTNS